LVVVDDGVLVTPDDDATYTCEPRTDDEAAGSKNEDAATDVVAVVTAAEATTAAFVSNVIGVDDSDVLAVNTRLSCSDPDHSSFVQSSVPHSASFSPFTVGFSLFHVSI